ncbi:MAG: hypothetical protein GF311_03185 [Candidatus Lokiarchaeota archaeon]|nr:hypothetical protein [Candidatus Lokiarchaeota archaeon]
MLSINLVKNIYFFNIGGYGNDDNYFQWTSKFYNKNPHFQIKITRNPPHKDIFYTINNPDITIVYYAKDDTVFTIAGHPNLQSQLLEAMLEYLVSEFYDMYDSSLLTTCYGDTCDVFDGFSMVVLDLLNNFDEKNLIKITRVNCKGCDKKTQEIIIKKSLIQNSNSSTTPLVFIHSGHALLIYIDNDFKVRGSQLVDVSY